MDDDIASALSRLLLVSGGPEKAKQYLEAYTDRGGSSDLSSASTPSSGGADLQPLSTVTIPPPLLLLPATNPWQQNDDAPLRVVSSVESLPRSNATSPRREVQSHGKYRDRTEHRAKTARGPTDRSLAWGDNGGFVMSSPSMTSARSQSDRTRTPEVLSQPQLYDMENALTSTPTTSMLSWVSDQPPSARGTLSTPPSTPGRELRRSSRSRNAGMTTDLSPSPIRVHGRPNPCPAQDNGARITELHTDIAAIEWRESSLSREEFETVRSKIKADPEYLGEEPYIQVQNPQHKIKILVHTPAKSRSTKWYQVSKGTAIGIFSSWDPTANATQGVSGAVFKSFNSRTDAIVAYQVSLLRGQVYLMNEKE